MGGIHKHVPDGLAEVDVIIAGGGTTGCVVASRLSDADPTLSILIVERGPDSLDDPTVTNPLFFIENILDLPEPNPRMMYYKGQKDPSSANTPVVIPAGSILGGGSAINMLTYARAQREDLDAWNMPGWSADGLLPYMKKFETYHGPGLLDSHGTNGPIHISEGPFERTSLQDQFIEAAAKVGFPESLDLQDLDSNQAVQRNLRFISKNGIRQDSAHGYLQPRLKDGKHPNLNVLVEHNVLRIIIKDNRTVGVEVQGNPAFQKDARAHKIKAKKMVVASAGTLGTPLLLERSGVGDRDVLSRAGNNAVVNLPGIGKDLQDHNTLMVSYYTSLSPDETYDGLLNGKTSYQKLLDKKSPMLAWNSAEITSKVRPTDEETDSILGPNARRLWERDFKDNPNKPVAVISTANGFIAPIPESDSEERFLSTGSFLLYPYARGHVHVSSQPLGGEIDIKTGILTDPAGFDLAMAMWLYKKQREIVRRLDVYRGEFPALHPPFDADSDAVCKKRSEPLPPDVKNIVYSVADDAVLKKWVQERLAQNWHAIGTCKMAPLGKQGVVDERLGVYGVEALKIADLSVVPVNLAANPASMAFAIGEKAGDMFARELEQTK